MPTEPPTTHEFSPCPGCGYDLAGLASGVCPECARPFTNRELWRSGQHRKWNWVWLDDTMRLVFWLWIAMLVGLVLLRLFEGEGLSVWLGVGVVGLAGAFLARWQRGLIRKARSSPERAARGPTRWRRWCVQAHCGVAILIAVPIAGMACLLVLAGLLSVVYR